MSELKSLSQDVLKTHQTLTPTILNFNWGAVIPDVQREFNGISLFAATTEATGGSAAVFGNNNSSTDNNHDIHNKGGSSGPKVRYTRLCF